MDASTNSKHSIAIIGAGSVGSAIAHTLLLHRVVSSLILVDIDASLCRAQVLDLSDATFLSNVHIRCGSFADAAKADIIIITAGAKQKPGDTRLDLIERNYRVLKSIMGELRAGDGLRQDAVVVVVANPVDVLTYFAQKLSGLPRGQVLGSGTLLDSIRLRRILGEKLDVADTSVHAFVIGEHGDSQCVAWSTSTVHGTPLLKLLPLSASEREEIATTTRSKADTIIRIKGFTSYGVAAVTARICESIVFDQKRVLPLSHWREELGCCLSLPAVLGRGGVLRSMEMGLNPEEQGFLEDSARALRGVVEQYEAEKAKERNN